MSAPIPGKQLSEVSFSGLKGLADILGDYKKFEEEKYETAKSMTHTNPEGALNLFQEIVDFKDTSPHLRIAAKYEILQISIDLLKKGDGTRMVSIKSLVVDLLNNSDTPFEILEFCTSYNQQRFDVAKSMKQSHPLVALDLFQEVVDSDHSSNSILTVKFEMLKILCALLLNKQSLQIDRMKTLVEELLKNSETSLEISAFCTQVTAHIKYDEARSVRHSDSSLALKLFEEIIHLENVPKNLITNAKYGMLKILSDLFLQGDLTKKSQMENLLDDLIENSDVSQEIWEFCRFTKASLQMPIRDEKTWGATVGLYSDIIKNPKTSPETLNNAKFSLALLYSSKPTFIRQATLLYYELLNDKNIKEMIADKCYLNLGKIYEADNKIQEAGEFYRKILNKANKTGQKAKAAFEKIKPTFEGILRNKFDVATRVVDGISKGKQTKESLSQEEEKKLLTVQQLFSKILKYFTEEKDEDMIVSVKYEIAQVLHIRGKKISQQEQLLMLTYLDEVISKSHEKQPYAYALKGYIKYENYLNREDRAFNPNEIANIIDLFQTAKRLGNNKQFDNLYDKSVKSLSKLTVSAIKNK